MLSCRVPCPQSLWPHSPPPANLCPCRNPARHLPSTCQAPASAAGSVVAHLVARQTELSASRSCALSRWPATSSTTCPEGSKCQHEASAGCLPAQLMRSRKLARCSSMPGLRSLPSRSFTQEASVSSPLGNGAGQATAALPQASGCSAHLAGQVEPINGSWRVGCHWRVVQGVAEAGVHDDSAAQVQPAAAVAAESAGAEGATAGAPCTRPLASVAAPHPACVLLQWYMPRLLASLPVGLCRSSKPAGQSLAPSLQPPVPPRLRQRLPLRLRF